MNRRNFLKNLGVLLAATQLPTRLLDGVELAANTIVLNEPRFVTYSLGFTITREMLDDDLYGGSAFLAAGLAAQMKKDIDSKLHEGTWRRWHDFDTDTTTFQKLHRSTNPSTEELEIDYED